MLNKVIRLQSIEMINFKNIQYGKIDFASYKKIKKDFCFDNKSNIVGIYGQNGSGKTSVVEALGILKALMSGDKIQSDIKYFISTSSETAQLKYTFFIEEDTSKYLVNYDLEIKKSSNLIGAEISSEKLSYTKVNEKGKMTIVSYGENLSKTPILPEVRYKELLQQNKENEVDLLVIYKLCKKENTSFIFHNELIEMFNNNKHNEYYNIMRTLDYYAKMNLFIIKSEHSATISLNFMPISFRLEKEGRISSGDIPVNLLGKSNVPEKKYLLVKKVLEQMNIVLNNIIPNLNVQIVDLGKELNETGEELISIELVSVRDNVKIPLRYESEGIKKIISILSTLVSVFNDPSICLVIDELDSGIFEYLLGELLVILEKNGKGQIIFTSHNLIALERLPKESIVISTANSLNRFIQLTNIKATNNLRNVYLRSIDLGGLSEPIYQETNMYEISHAFRKAGKIVEK